MVNIGIVGIGFMGVTHFKAIQKVKGARVTAICTRDEKKLQGDWRKIQGNFGDSGGQQDLSGIARYSHLEDLLEDPRVDLVDICLPTPMHTGSTLQALEAGKHVFLEKPISLNLSDADRMIAAAQKRKLCFMVAHVLRFMPEFRLIKELVVNKKYGRIQAAHFKRIISHPSWWDPKIMAQNGGPAIDLHIHDADFVQYLFGMPQAVSSNGFMERGQMVQYLDTHYYYDGRPLAIGAEGGWLSQSGCPFEHGYDVYFEDATIKYNSSWGESPILLSKDGKKRRPRLPGKDGFVGELQEAVDAVRAGKVAKDLSGQSARNSLLLCLREIQSVRSGRKVRI